MRLTIGQFAGDLSAERLKAFGELSPDFAALQNLAFDESAEDDRLARAAVRNEPYVSFRERYSEDGGRGIAILAGLGQTLTHEQATIVVGGVAQRILVQLPRERTLWLTNVQLRGEGSPHAMNALVSWISEAPPADANIVCALFDPDRESDFGRRIERAGLHDASEMHTAAHRLYLSGAVSALAVMTDSLAITSVILEL